MSSAAVRRREAVRDSSSHPRSTLIGCSRSKDPPEREHRREQGSEASSMRIFISAGEPSGDLHAANLIRSIRRRLPAGDVEFVGYGGARMAGAGAELLYPLVDLAVMWFLNVLLNI